MTREWSGCERRSLWPPSQIVHAKHHGLGQALAPACGSARHRLSHERCPAPGKPEASAVMRRVSRSASVGVALVPHRRDIPGSGVAAVNGRLIRNCPALRAMSRWDVPEDCRWPREAASQEVGLRHRSGRVGLRRSFVGRVATACDNQVAAATRSSAVIRGSTSPRTSRPAWCIMARQSAMVWTVPTVPRIVS